MIFDRLVKVALTDFKSDGFGLILGTVGSIPTHFRQAP